MKKFFKKLSGITILATAVFVLAACGNSTKKTASTSATEKEQTVIRVGATGQSFPNSYKEGDELVGFDVEVFEAVAKKLGYKVEWTTGSFDGLVAQLNTGKLDTIANNFAITDERKKTLQFSDVYAYAHTGIAVKEDSTAKELKDLEGQTIAGVSGSNKVTILEEYIKENNLDITVRTYDTREGAQLDTEKGQVAGYVQDSAILSATIKKDDLPLRVLPDSLSNDQVAFPFLKNDAGDKLKKAFDKELVKLQKDGTLTKLSKKYYGSDVTKE